ncbi:hypothetical protein FOA52_014917 [Chlamydomonas sp. UWO 241]|nr:hypothetical protein FOA52_014917 [Chlamydomonas sp. UWO 241]
MLAAAAACHGAPRDAFALALAMAQPFVPLVLSGAATVGHLRSNAQALALVGCLSAEDVQRVTGSLRQDPLEYWGERSALTWN